MAPEIKNGYQKKDFDNIIESYNESIEEEEEENRNINWKFVRKQLVKTILFPLAIFGLVNF